MAVIGEEALEVDRPNAVVALLEAYLPEKQLVARSREHGEVYAAEVDEVKSASAHNEQSVAVVVVEGSGEVVYDAALVRQLKLTYSRKSIVYGYRVSQQVGVKFHTAQLTDVLLFFLGLYW